MRSRRSQSPLARRDPCPAVCHSPIDLFRCLAEDGSQRCPLCAIPDYRLPAEDIDMDLERIQEMGIEIHTSSTIGSKPNIRNLKIKYDAVLLATGADKLFWPDT